MSPSVTRSRRGNCSRNLSAPQILAELKERTAQQAKAAGRIRRGPPVRSQMQAEDAAAQRCGSIANGGDKEAAEAFVEIGPIGHRGGQS